MTRQLGLRLMLAAVFVAAVAAFFASGAQHWLTLEGLKEQQASLLDLRMDHPWLVVGGFFIIYVAMTALSLPSAILLTVLAGALFGTLWGTILVSFASTLGSTLAMLAARYLLRDSLQTQYGQQLRRFNEGFSREGVFYLFALRLVPVMPFFIVNLLMGLLPIKTPTYWWVSQLGMLPGTVVYVYAGTALASISSLRDIVSPPLLLAFALLGLLPLATKYLLNLLRESR